MHVLVVCNNALPHIGGLENLVDLEIRGLAADGHRVTLLTSNNGGAGRTPDYPASVRTLRVPAWHGLERRFGIPYPVFSPRLLTTLWREVGAADVVHAHGFMFHNTALAVVVSRLRQKPCLLTDHGGIQQFSSRLTTTLARIGAETVGRMSATLATRIVTYNSRIQQTMARLGRRKDVEFLPNPVDDSVFYSPSPSERASARAALNWTGVRPKVLYVGRLIAAKGVPLLAAAGTPDVDLVFCGPGDVSLLGPLPRSGIEYLQPRPQSELRTLYHAADVLVLPADVREGFPLVVQEAVACGLPVVLGYDPGFEPYRRLPNLVFCERTVDSVRASVKQALETPRAVTTVGGFPALGEWVRELFRTHAAASAAIATREMTCASA